MPEYRYALAKYEPSRPWLPVGPIQHLTVELGEGESFAAWAAREWPAPRFKAELEREELGPWQRPG